MTRVMLEKPRDYFQDLVDLGCTPDHLGTVTYDPVTRKVDVSGSVYLNEQDLDRLPFAFGKVGGYFWCARNRLTSLEGAPREVGWHFGCYNNRLTSLEGAPSRIGWNFGCSADGLRDVSALKHCKIKGALYFMGPTADQERVTQMLKVQGYEGRISCLV